MTGHFPYDGYYTGISCMFQKAFLYQADLILCQNFNIQAFCDLEPIYTYEGTYDINSLVTAREVTGIASFKPASRSRL